MCVCVCVCVCVFVCVCVHAWICYQQGVYLFGLLSNDMHYWNGNDTVMRIPMCVRARVCACVHLHVYSYVFLYIIPIWPGLISFSNLFS